MEPQSFGIGRTLRAAATAVLLAGCTVTAGRVQTDSADIGAALSIATADSASEREVAPGVLHHRMLWYDDGPRVVQWVEIDLRACGIDLRTVKATDRVIGRETTSSMARRTAASLGRPVLVAINADFFNFEPPGLPEGPQVSAGEVVVSEGIARAALEDKQLRDQPVFALTEDERPILGNAYLTGTVRLPSGATLTLAGANARPVADSVTLYNRWWGEETPADTGVIEVVIDRDTAPRAIGDTARGRIARIDTSAAGVRLHPERVVIAGRGAAAAALREQALGDTVRWSFSFTGLPPRIVELIGGYPMLLDDGRPVHDIDDLIPSFARNRHPRAAIGIRDNGSLVLMAVDGRQPDYSVGMSLAELASFLRASGIRDALNLDGGGSTTLVIDGDVVNRPSDESGERAVANALLVLGPTPGSCPAR